MFNYVLLGYIVLYAIIAVGIFSLYALIVPGEEKKRDKPWETPLDLLLSVTGLAGMLFLYLHFEPYWLKIAWRPVSVSLVVVQIWWNLKYRGSWHHSPTADFDKESATAADLTTLVFLAPSLVLNLFYAFR